MEVAIYIVHTSYLTYYAIYFFKSTSCSVQLNMQEYVILKQV